MAMWTGPPSGGATDFGCCPVAGEQARATALIWALGQSLQFFIQEALCLQLQTITISRVI